MCKWGHRHTRAHTLPPTLGGVAPAVALRVVRQGQQVDAGGASTGAKDGDAQGVPTEGRNVLTGPAQSLDQIQQAVVALGRLVASAQKACRRKERERMGGREEERQGREEGQRRQPGSTFPPAEYLKMHWAFSKKKKERKVKHKTVRQGLWHQMQFYKPTNRATSWEQRAEWSESLAHGVATPESVSSFNIIFWNW